MRGKDERKIRRAPQAGHGPGGVDKNVCTDGHGRGTRFFNMYAIVHTARAARASTADGHDHVITPCGQLLNHFRSRRL